MHGMFQRALTLAVLMTAGLLHAQAPLADVIPADALVYIGWQGSDALGVSYQKSSMKGVMDAINFQETIDAAMKQASADASTDPKRVANLKLATSLGNDILRYPAAFYFGGVDLTGDKIALIVKSGKEKAAALAPDIQKAADDNRKPNDPPSSAKAVGDYLVITVGEVQDLTQMLTGRNNHLTQALSARKEFIAALAQSHKDPAFVAFVNAAEVLKLADDAVALRANNRFKDMFPKVMDVLGVDSVKYAIFTGGFDGPEWSSQAFVAMKERRNGLLQFLDNKPLSDDALKMIPKSATWAGAIRIDGDRFVTDLRESAGRIDDQAQARLDGAIQAATKMTGVDVHKDLLASLGDEWLYYGTPDATGNSFKGLTVVNKLRDPATAERAIGDLELFVAGMMAQRGNNDVTFATEKVGELAVHVISWKANGGGTVAWAIQTGVLYVSLTPQGVQAAVDHVAKKGPNITENPEYALLRKKLGVDNAASFAFSDLAKIAPDAYAKLLALVEKIQRDHPDAKVKVTLPAYEKIKPFMTTMGSVTWTDAEGWHAKSHEPFPASSLVIGLPAIIEGMAMQAAQRRPGRTPPMPKDQQLP